MKALIQKLVLMIGWKKALLWIWEAADDGLKEHAKATSNPYDDKAFEYLDHIIRDITKE